MFRNKEIEDLKIINHDIERQLSAIRISLGGIKKENISCTLKPYHFQHGHHIFKSGKIKEIEKRLEFLEERVSQCYFGLGTVEGYRSVKIHALEEKISHLEKFLSIQLKNTPETKKYVRVKK